MHRPSSALSAGPVPTREPAAGEGPRRVLARAGAEIVQRGRDLDEGERGPTAAVFERPLGPFVGARRGDAAGPLVGGVGLRAGGVGPSATGPRQPDAVALHASPGWDPDPSNGAAQGFRFAKEAAAPE
jgi:hypothetical protein